MDEPLGEEGPLRDEFVVAFDHQWVPRNPYRLARHEVLSYSWDEFARYVREEARSSSSARGGRAPPTPS